MKRLSSEDDRTCNTPPRATRRLIAIDAVIARLRRGDTLRHAVSAGGPLWWFEAPYQQVCPDVVRAIMLRETLPPALCGGQDFVSLVGLGDSLFRHPHESQSWRAVWGRRQ